MSIAEELSDIADEIEDAAAVTDWGSMDDKRQDWATRLNKIAGRVLSEAGEVSQ